MNTIDEIKTCFNDCWKNPVIKQLDWINEQSNGRILISILTAEWYDKNENPMTPSSCILPDEYVMRLNSLGYEIDCYDSYHFVVWKSVNI